MMGGGGGLFPATFHNPKTAFTFQVLTEFYLDNLEHKTMPSQFFSCLKRLTNDQVSEYGAGEKSDCIYP